MTDQSFTPSWIKIDDDKFRDLLEYLCRKARSGGHDPFYSAAQELLKERVSSLMPELACGMEGSEEEQLFRIRLGGHIHKANGLEESGGTVFSNAAMMDEHYGMLREPHLINL